MSPILPTRHGAIDVHAHFLPDRYRDALEQAGMSRPDNIPGLPRWSAAATIETMDEIGIGASVLSISSPGVAISSEEETIRLAHDVNLVGASTMCDAPTRFGFYASLPIPHVDAALAELERALDELNADGVALMTNVCGRYVGDPMFRELLEEMDRREVVVLLHPASPPNYAAVSFGRPTPILEFPFETTRTVADLILSGATTRFPRIRWIVPHAGAALPVLAARIAFVAELLGTEGAEIDVDAELRRMYYDLAGAPLPILLPALVSLVGTDCLLYGSDTPFTPQADAARLAAGLAETEILRGPARDAAVRGNALTLFRRFSIGDDQ